MRLQLIACAAMVFARAYAQETPPVVQVNASADLQRQRDTASRATITRAEILKYGAVSALDVLKRLPGVSVSDGVPRMRGLGAGYTQVLLNGERPLPGFSLESLTPDMVDRIEVIRAATAEHSTQAVAGTINIVLRKSAGKPSREWRASATAPAHLPSRSAGLGLAGKDDTGGYTFNASLTQGNNHGPEHTDVLESKPDGTVTSRRIEDERSRNRFLFLNLNSRVNWKLEPGTTLGWQTFLGMRRLDADLARDVQLTGGTDLPFTHSDYRRRDKAATLRTEGNWSRSWGDGGRIESTLSFSGDQAQNDRNSGYQVQPGERALARRYDVDDGSRRGGWTGKLSLAPGPGHALSLGWDASSSLQRQHELQDETATSQAGAIDFDRTSRVRLRRLAGYVQDEWDMSDGWSVYGGVRRETSDTRGSGSDFAAVTTRTGVTSPILQLLWKLPGEQGRQLRIALARTYKAPATNQLMPRHFLSLVNTELTPDSSGNPLLRPELARGFDVAFESYGKDGALFSLAAGTRHISDVIFNAVGRQDGRWVSSPSNFGNARTGSLELEWKGPVPDTPLRFSLNTGRYWSRVDAVAGPDNRLARQPRWTANAGGEYRAGPWGAGANLTYSATGWVRIAQGQSVYNSVVRDLEGYASYRPSPDSQWRIGAGSLLRQPSLAKNLYVDDNGRKENATSTGAGAWIRVGYERQF